jgi:class 3 adenylate cyclase
VALGESWWEANGATPARLMLLPAFRSLLSTEALAPGFELAVGRVGLIFTDLAGSTALYDRIGDARAFALVGEHFNVLLQPIEAAGGAVVKTIGDAIMAAFPDGRSALSAGLNMQRAIRSLAGSDIPDATHLLKVGVHVGACFAVTLNERLDYFGGVVNLAARAQNEARGGEVVLTQEVAEEAGTDLALCGGAVETFEVHLRGFGAPTKLVRIDASQLS